MNNYVIHQILIIQEELEDGYIFTREELEILDKQVLQDILNQCEIDLEEQKLLKLSKIL